MHNVLRRLKTWVESGRALRRMEDLEAKKHDALERQLWEAHRDWQLACMRLDEALGADEVDYAVLTLQAAERRYDMLLRKAKEQGLVQTEWRRTLADQSVRSAPRAHGPKEEAGWSRDG